MIAKGSNGEGTGILTVDVRGEPAEIARIVSDEDSAVARDGDADWTYRSIKRETGGEVGQSEPGSDAGLR
jgi:hypothetical protein